MNTLDPATLMQWMDADLDGDDSFGAAEAERFEQALASDDALVAERGRLRKLHAMLRGPEIQVREGFADDVMAGLPQAAWETETSRAAWWLPIAALVTFAAGALALLGGLADSALVGTSLAVVDFLSTTTLAGAGLLEASWRGAGLGLEEMFAGSPSTIAALAILVLGLDILFLSMLQKRARRTAEVTVTETESAD